MKRGNSKAKSSGVFDLVEIVGNIGELFESPLVIGVALLLLVIAGIMKLMQWIDSFE